MNVGENNNPSSITNTILGDAEGSLSNTGILYSVSSGDLTLNPGVNFNVTLPTAYTLDGDINSTGNLVFYGPVAISTSNPTLTANEITIEGNVNGDGNGLTIDNSGASTISGVMSNLSSFTMDGTGDLKLTGVNTFTGPTILNDGTLTISTDSALGAAPATATPGQLVLDGGTLEITSSSFTLNANRGILLDSRRYNTN